MISDNTLYAKNKLGIVNQCLISIGQRPLLVGTTLDALAIGSEGYIAKEMVSNVMLDVQTRGWYFNTDIDYEFVPDADGFIAIPANLLRLDAGSKNDKGRYIIKSGKLYDRKEKTFKFTDKITADVVWAIEYEDLPFLAYAYISARAARKFQQSVLGSQTLNEFGVRDEMDTLYALEREEAQYLDTNILDTRFL